MSGHSKWSTIKRQKQVTDKTRGLAFTKHANAIMMAVKEGGSKDPAFNFRLRLAVDKAKSANMPKANIDRAIERGTSKANEKALHEVLYEGFGPQGIAIMAEGMTDNHQRTAAEVKNIFQRYGGTLGSVGSVVYLFDRVGELSFDPLTTTLDNLYAAVADTNALNIVEQEDSYILYTPVDALEKIRQIVDQKGLQATGAELVYLPKSPLIPQSGVESTEKCIALIEALDESSDIHKVYTNVVIESV